MSFVNVGPLSAMDTGIGQGGANTWLPPPLPANRHLTLAATGTLLSGSIATSAARSRAVNLRSGHSIPSRQRTIPEQSAVAATDA